MLPEGYTLPVDQRPRADWERYSPAHALHRAGQRCVVFFEDAGAYHGVPTCLFDLYLLVDDIDAAAGVLTGGRWVPVPSKRRIGNSTVDVDLRRLARRDVEQQPAQDVVLLSARDWYFDLAASNTFPPLVPLVNALYDTIFHGTWSQFRWSSLHLSYLYGHVPGLKDLDVAQICPAGQGVHLDVLRGIPLSSSLARHRAPLPLAPNLSHQYSSVAV